MFIFYCETHYLQTCKHDVRITSAVAIGVNTGGTRPAEITVRGTPMLFAPPLDFDLKNGKI